MEESGPDPTTDKYSHPVTGMRCRCGARRRQGAGSGAGTRSSTGVQWFSKVVFLFFFLLA